MAGITLHHLKLLWQAHFYVVLTVLYLRLVCPSPDPVHHLCVAFSRGKNQQLATRLLLIACTG